MSTTESARGEVDGETAAQAHSPAGTEPSFVGASWPATSRLLPWSIAAFIGALWLAPVDGVQLPVTLPVDAKLDRFLIGAIVILWLLVIAGARRGLGPVSRWGPVGSALVVWVTVLGFSLAANAVSLSQVGDLDDGIKAFSLIVSYALFYLVVTTSIRPSEVPRLLDFSLGLACVMAVGIVVQYRTGINWFTRIPEAIPGLTVSAPPFSRVGAREQINGPTGHGLAACTILALLVPHALLSIVDSPGARRKVLSALALFLLVAGSVATQRKSAIVIPLAAVLVVVAYRPRDMLKLAPLGAVLVVGLQILTPGGLSGLRYQFSIAGQSGSTTERIADYSATWPDIASSPLLGRGYGSYTASKYRFLDNELLGQAVTVGALGLAAYASLLITTLMVGHRLVSRSTGLQRRTTMALVAGVAGFLVSNLLFDALSFRQVPYLLMLLLAFLTILASQRPEDVRDLADPDPLPDEIPPASHRRVAAIVVTYDNEADIEECLIHLVGAAEGVDLEVVVVDNASSDATVATATRCSPPSTQILPQAENLGFARACNVGVAASTAEWIVLVNPDARPAPGCFAALLDFDLTHPGAGLVGGRSLRPDGSPGRDSAWGAMSLWSTFCFATLLSTAFARSVVFDPESLGDWQRDSVREVGVVTGLLLLARREVWDRLGGFDETFFMYGEDADLSARARAAGYRPAITPAALVVHEGGASSASAGAKTIFLLRGKVTLVRKQWSGPKAGLAVQLLIVGVGMRALLSRVTSSRAAGPAWRDAWAARAEWRSGYGHEAG